MKLQLYILRALFIGLVYAVVGTFVLAMPGIAVAAVSRLAGVDMRTLAYYVPLLMLNLVPYALPLGFLLSVVVTYGRLAADREWTAVCMAGINPIMMLGPALALGLALSAGTMWLIGTVLPHARLEASQYRFTALRRMITHLNPGRTELHLGKFYLSAAHREGDDFLDAFIYIPSLKEASAKTLIADRVHFEFQGHEMLVYFDNPRTVLGDFAFSGGRPILRIDMDQLQTESESSYRAMRFKATSELSSALALAPMGSKKANDLTFEIHQRWAISTTYLMFLLLGVPTGLLMHRGTQLGALAVAVGYALLYYILSMRLGQQLATAHVLSPLIGAWSVNAMGITAGLMLLRKALRS